METLTIDELARHQVSELTRGRKEIYEEAAEQGVVFDAAKDRPELVMMALPNLRRYMAMNQLALIAGNVLGDLAPLIAGKRPTSWHVAWLELFDDDDLRAFVGEFAQAMRLAMEMVDPTPAFRVLHRWKSTAEYDLAGAPLSGELDWAHMIGLDRPVADEARK